MNRIEKMKELVKLEEKKEQLLNIKNDMNNYYFKRCKIVVYVETKSFERSSFKEGEEMEVFNPSFMNFIEQELLIIKSTIEKLMDELS